MLLALPLVGGATRSETRVLVDHGRVSIHSESAPLAEVLSRFARATGAEVVYETARPRQPVSVVIEADSAAEAIAQLLEGQGLNYALRLDPSGRNVEMLVVTGSAGPPAASAGATRTLRSPATPPPQEVDDVAPGGDVDQPFAPEAADGPDSLLPPGTSPEDVMNPTLLAPGLGVAPGAPPGLEPSSPEAPSGSAAPAPGQPMPPAPASYPGSAPAIPPVPSQPVYPGPASYPGGA